MRFIDEADEDLVNVWLDRYNRSQQRGAMDPEAAAGFFQQMEEHRRYQVALSAEQAETAARP